jgi:arsenate reductase
MRVMKRNDTILLLSYIGCDTCKKAQRWLDANGAKYEVRAIVDAPPTPKELARWIPASGLSVRKWLNTSGQSYRAIGKESVDAASDAELTQWLARDGKLVKRPLLVSGGDVLVGFRPEAYEKVLGS